MANTVDELVAAIADSRMADVAASIAEEVSKSGESSIRCCCGEGVTWMMAMLVANVTIHAQIIVLAREAGDELLLGQALNAAVASACQIVLAVDGLLFVGISARHILLSLFWLCLDLRGNALRGAVHDASVLHESLHHPVASARAVDAVIDAGGAKVVVATVAHSAMEVLVLHGVVAVVAVYHP